MPKILSEEEAIHWRNRNAAAGLSVGFTCGAFDLLHAGHADYLAKARDLCDRLLVAVNSDQSIRLYKSPLRPIVEQAQRISLIAALQCVDAVVLMDDLRPARLIELLKPDVYIKGGDYESSKLKSAALVSSYGGRTEVIKIEYPVSSSELIRRIKALDTYETGSVPARTLRSPLLFLDRDGTIIKNKHFLRDPGAVELLDGAGEALRTFQDAGYTLVLVTNQQGLGLGYFDYPEFIAVNSKMFALLSAHGVSISRVYYCPHSQADRCKCRKPGTELIDKALRYFGAEASDCVFVGDTDADVLAAHAVGCKSVFLGNKPPIGSRPDVVAANWAEIAASIALVQK